MIPPLHLGLVWFSGRPAVHTKVPHVTNLSRESPMIDDAARVPLRSILVSRSSSPVALPRKPGKGIPHRREVYADLLSEVLDLRTRVAADGAAIRAELTSLTGLDRASEGIANLGHYLAIRHHDLRPLQRRLMAHGLSSLGRLESRVLPTLDAVIAALSALAGRRSPVEAPSEQAFFRGEAELERHTNELFGPPPQRRRARIMVTLPGEAARDPGFVLRLAEAGMDLARINCAHDDRDAWIAMASHVRKASSRTGRSIRVLMDVAGPKIRTETIDCLDPGRKLAQGDMFVLQAGGKPQATPETPFAAVASLPEIVNRLRVGDRVLYDDGKMEGVVESGSGGRVAVRIRRARSGGVRFKPHKGLNLPDTALGLSPLTAKDERDLDAVIEAADMIGYSFVAHAEDIDLLEEVLRRKNAERKPFGLVAKIERPDAVANLPRLMARAVGSRPFAVMIARGDLAAEIGFARLAEMQEEILWLCEAAGVPAIWATQVLEDLVKHGVPSRGEMTDAAMAARAECVMLNKGPEVVAAVEVLDGLMARMDDHLFKKTPRLRALASW